MSISSKYIRLKSGEPAFISHNNSGQDRMTTIQVSMLVDHHDLERLNVMVNKLKGTMHHPLTRQIHTGECIVQFDLQSETYSTFWEQWEPVAGQSKRHRKNVFKNVVRKILSSNLVRRLTQ